MEKHKNTPLYESIFDHATIGILVSDSFGKIISANRFALNIFGYQPGELIGLPVETLIPGRYKKAHIKQRSAYQEKAETRAMGAGRDLYGLKKDGTEFPVEISLSPFESNGRSYVFAFVIDISVRKKMEASERNYQKKVTDILASLRKEKELTDMQSNFISMASHEFKTPLTTILSSAALLKKYTETDQQPQRDKHIDRIQSAVRNINRILNDFLTIDKVKSQKLNVHHSIFNLQEFLLEIQAEFDHLAKKDQILKYQHKGNEIVNLDQELLRNIISNILTNASKFSEPGTLIEMNSECTEKNLYIRIKDQGFGISEEDKKHIFERFFRGQNALTIPGTGLGLHIVRNYVELMRGTIEIKSELNQGTEVILSFKQ